LTNTIEKKYTFEVNAGEIIGTIETTYRFEESGVECSAKDLRKKAAGDKLAHFALDHLKRHGGSFSDALRVAMHISPEYTRDYFRQ